MDIKQVPTSIETTINEVCETLDSWTKNKEISLVKDIQDNLPQIHIDPDRTIQVLINIVSNAIKFTPKSGLITISAKIPENSDMMEVSVTDTGVGIPKKRLN